MLYKEQPSQFLSETDKYKDRGLWFKQNLEFISSRYNASQVRLQSLAKIEQNRANGPVNEMIRMAKYYLGIQENRDYFYSTQTEDNCEIPSVWISGQKVTSLVDYMVGKATEMISNMEATVKATSKAAVNKKTMLLEQGLLRIQLKDLFDEFLNQTGIDFSPMGSKQFENSEELMRYMENDYKEQNEEMAERLAEDIILRNRYDERLKQAFLYLIVNGIIGIYNYIENGKQWQSLIEPWNLIPDLSEDDEYNDRARFVGRVFWRSPIEILDKYSKDLSAEEQQIYRELNRDNVHKFFENTSNARWYQLIPGSDVPVIMCVEGYWIGAKDLRYTRKVDKYGNEHFEKSVKDGSQSDAITKMVYQGTLLGNRHVVDYGEASNVVRKTDNFADVELPIKVFIPNIIMGDYRSVVSKLHQHQDRIDYLTHKLTKMIDQSPGKKYIINKNKLGSATSKEVLNDFQSYGLHVTDGNTSGEENDPNANDRMVEVVDMTLDPSIGQIIALKQEEERIMEEIINISKIALGQQTGYVGAKTQAGTISQSSLGTISLYNGFMRFVEKCLQYGINQYKVALTAESETEIPLVGTKGRQFLKLTEDFTFEDFRVYIKIKDFIDQQGRDRILSIAQAAMQNQVIEFSDYVKIEKARTYTEILNELEYTLNKKKREQEKAAQQQAIMEQVAMERQNQAQMGMQETAEQGQNYRTELKVAADMAKTANQSAGNEQPPVM